MCKCSQCGGTGRVFIAKSAFSSDGYTQQRCWMCAGTGESNQHGDAQFASTQRRIRELGKFQEAAL